MQIIDSRQVRNLIWIAEAEKYYPHKKARPKSIKNAIQQIQLT